MTGGPMERRLRDRQAAYALLTRRRIAARGDRDRAIADAVASGELTGREIAAMTGLTPSRISQLTRADRDG